MTDPPLYRISVSRTSGTSVVTLAGELDLAGQSDIQQTIVEELTDARAGHVIIDMAAVGFLDSTAISALVAAYHHAREQGAVVSIVNPSSQVTRLLQLTGLLRLFQPDDVPPPD